MFRRVGSGSHRERLRSKIGEVASLMTGTTATPNFPTFTDDDKPTLHSKIIIKSGLLNFNKSSVSKAAYVLRTFVLTDGSLHWFSSGKGNILLGEHRGILLTADMKRAYSDPSIEGQTFKLEMEDGSIYLLAASNEARRDEWISALTNCCISSKCSENSSLTDISSVENLGVLQPCEACRSMVISTISTGPSLAPHVGVNSSTFRGINGIVSGTELDRLVGLTCSLIKNTIEFRIRRGEAIRMWFLSGVVYQISNPGTENERIDARDGNSGEAVEIPEGFTCQVTVTPITEPVAGNESSIDRPLDVPNSVLQHIGLVMVAVGVAEYHLLDSRISAMPLLGLLILVLSALVGIKTLNRWFGGQTERSSAAAAKRSQLLSAVLRIDHNSAYIGSDRHNPSMHNLMTAKVAEIPPPHSQPNTDTVTRAAAPPAYDTSTTSTTATGSTEGGQLTDRFIRGSRATVQGMATLDAENIDPRDPTGELLSKMTELYPNDGPVTLTRFLRARNYNLERASDMRAEDLIMRSKFGILRDEEFVRIFRLGLAYMHGFAKDQTPVAVILVKKLDVTVLTAEDVQKLVIYVTDQIKKLCPKSESATIIVDLKGFSLKKNMNISLYLEAINLVNKCLPEVLEKVRLVNAPYLFKGVWSVIKKALDEHTVSKIDFYDESEFRHFLDFIEPENLPIQYGGTSMFDFNKDFYGRFRVGFMPLGIEVDLTQVSLEDAMAEINKLDDTYMASG